MWVWRQERRRSAATTLDGELIWVRVLIVDGHVIARQLPPGDY